MRDWVRWDKGLGKVGWGEVGWGITQMGGVRNLLRGGRGSVCCCTPVSDLPVPSHHHQSRT